MKYAIEQIEGLLQQLEDSEPKSRHFGDIARADAEAVAAAGCRQALKVLNAAADGPVWPPPSTGADRATCTQDVQVGPGTAAP